MSEPESLHQATPFADSLAQMLGGALSADCARREARERLERLVVFCPVYRDSLLRFPELWQWLESAVNQNTSFRYGTIHRLWDEHFLPAVTEDTWLSALQRFRRQVCLRVAYNELNGLSAITDSLKELSLLATFVLREVTHRVYVSSEKRFGTPWNEERNCPARFATIGLGKLGGGELNFCSDVDLIFLYQGQHHVHRQGRASAMTNEEFFTRVCRESVSLLQARGEEGYLYNVDLRLRPEGETGAIIRSLSSMENYYAATGQTWERLALVKARVVAGDEDLGSELLESLASFRYPRRPPPGLLMEIAGVKLRTEREVPAAKLALDIKSGPGGIREIEFFAQALQMIYAGRNPFLQTPSTLEALERLYRYEHITRSDRDFLVGAYLFLRALEHRLQMREEMQTHQLPPPGPDRALLAESLDFASVALFEQHLASVRKQVHDLYLLLFGMSDREAEIQEWTLFFSGQEPGPAIYPMLRRWFWGPLPPVETRLRHLLLGGSTHNLLTREHVTLFLEIAAQFDNTLGLLAHPMNTLERIDRFAERYGARKPFLNLCAHRPHFFRALGLLFDRSQFIHELLCASPEILEEIFVAGLKLAKPRGIMMDELAQLPHDSDEEFSAWLWLYVKAEQVRLAIANVLGHDGAAIAEYNLTKLTDVVLAQMLERADPERMLQVVALGKYGGQEMTIGSDLDIMLISAEEVTTEETTRRATRFLKLASHTGPRGKTFEIDLRLRPFGADGPIVTTLDSLAKYHAQGSARLWERQLLTRARCVSRDINKNTASSDEPLARAFVTWRDELLYSEALPYSALEDILTMRHRIEEEKAHVVPPQRAFKTGPGGMMDIEFAAQMLQMRHGWKQPSLRAPGTRPALKAAMETGVLAPDVSAVFNDNYEKLRTLELFLRRDTARSVSILSEDDDEQICIAKWMGFTDYPAFFSDHCTRMAATRTAMNTVFNDEKSRR
ncbi:MAG: hypothetical protein SFY80_12110 [Verrucomicrobiota bacterium]|nr:hypothetical protein [Verrucomicrobiota bacterium]